MELLNQSPLIMQLNGDGLLLRLGTVSVVLGPGSRPPLDPNKHGIQWDSEPVAFGHKHPFIIGLEKKNICMYSLYEQAIVQRLNVPQGALFCSNCHDKRDHLFISTAKKVPSMLATIFREAYLGIRTALTESSSAGGEWPMTVSQQ